VKLRIFPREESFFDLFEAAGDNLAEAAHLLLDMVEDFVDPEMKAKRLTDCEHEGDRLTHAILSRLNSTFITPFDREDIYALASNLDDVVDSLEAAADMLVLHRVSEPMRNYWIRINELENEGDRLYRHARADLYSFDVEAEHPARYLLMWKDIVDEIERALDELEHVAHSVESIVLKNA
jgi:uncharacterized protein Yka (UPF0111/DUF47 family)